MKTKINYVARNKAMQEFFTPEERMLIRSSLHKEIANTGTINPNRASKLNKIMDSFLSY
jgi:hypothetical protein